MTEKQLQSYFRAFAKEDFEFFLEYQSRNNYNHAEHTKYLSKLMQEVESGQIKRLIVSMPPRHGKSHMITQMFPVWYLGRNPDKEVMVASYSAELSSSFSRVSRNVMEELGTSIFDIKVSHDSRASDRWNIEGHKGSMFACGVGGSATGRGYSLGIIDDPVKNMEEAMSATYQERIIDWYRSVFRTRAAPNAAIILVMTRWSENDLAAHLLEEAIAGGEEWTVVSLPAIATNNDVLGREPGQFLWPERFTEEEYLAIKKSLGTRIWQALYQQEPTPSLGNIIQRSWINFYKNTPELDRTLVSVDASFKDSKDSDYVVFQYWGQSGANFYLLDQIRDKMDFVTTVASLQNFLKKNKTKTVLIEDKANGSAIISALRRSISGIIPINPRASKESRTQAVAPLFEAGNIFLPKEATFSNDLVEELVSFPGGKNDDQVDCLTQAVNYAQEHSLMKTNEAKTLRYALGL